MKKYFKQKEADFNSLYVFEQIFLTLLFDVYLTSVLQVLFICYIYENLFVNNKLIESLACEKTREILVEKIVFYLKNGTANAILDIHKEFIV